MHVDPGLVAFGQRLKRQHVELLSNFAFTFNLRRYTSARVAAEQRESSARKALEAQHAR